MFTFLQPWGIPTYYYQIYIVLRVSYKLVVFTNKLSINKEYMRLSSCILVTASMY